MHKGGDARKALSTAWCKPAMLMRSLAPTRASTWLALTSKMLQARTRTWIMMPERPLWSRSLYKLSRLLASGWA